MSYRVFKVNDYDWVATKFDKAHAYNWYINEFDLDYNEEEFADVEEVSLDDNVYGDDGEVATFRECIEAEGDSEEAYVIASTEY